MHIKFYLLLLLTLAAATCSSNPDNVEERAEKMLNQARELLAQKHYAAARDTIATMRQAYPTAFNTRAAGIVVMDSIELCKAQDSLITLNKWLQTELDVLTELERVDADTREGRDRIRAQKRKVSAVQWKTDEVCAKVNFFLRKIEMDKVKNATRTY